MELAGKSFSSENKRAQNFILQEQDIFIECHLSELSLHDFVSQEFVPVNVIISGTVIITIIIVIPLSPIRHYTLLERPPVLTVN